MSTIVKTIFDQIESMAQTELGSSWRKLRKVFAPVDNEFRGVENAFKCRHGGAFSADGVTRYYTLDHSFQVLLMRRFVDRGDDHNIQTTINDLYDKADELLTLFIKSRLQLPTTVLHVFNPSIGEPEVLANNSVLLTVGFDVKYRRQLDL